MLCLGNKAADWWRATPFLQFYQCCTALCFGCKLVLVFWRGTREDNLFLLQLCTTKLIELDQGFGKRVIVIRFWQVIFRFLCRLWTTSSKLRNARQIFVSLALFQFLLLFWIQFTANLSRSHTSGSTNFSLSKTIFTLLDNKIYPRCHLFLLANAREIYCWVALLSHKCVEFLQREEKMRSELRAPYEMTRTFLNVMWILQTSYSCVRNLLE